MIAKFGLNVNLTGERWGGNDGNDEDDESQTESPVASATKNGTIVLLTSAHLSVKL
jgi:hypothetical protein